MPLNANQIVGLTLQAVKAPGWKVQAQELLNLTLADLAGNIDLDLLRGTYSGITMVADNGSGNGSGPYNLPMDYKRAEWSGVWFVNNGTPYKLISVDLSQYRDQVQQAGIANFPEMYATDISPLAAEPPSNPLIYVWPPSSLATTLFIQYRRILPDIDFTTATGGLTVPWFPNQDYLLLMLKAQVGDLADDTRAPGWRLQAQQNLDSFLMLSNDDEGRAKTMKLDRRRFGQNYDSLPNTKTIGW